MAEEVKQEEKKADGKKIMATMFKVVLGLVFLALAVYLGFFRWLGSLKELVKGGIPIVLFFAGLITLAIAKE